MIALLPHVEWLGALLQSYLYGLEQHADDQLELHTLMLPLETVTASQPTGVSAWFEKGSSTVRTAGHWPACASCHTFWLVGFGAGPNGIAILWYKK